MDAPVLEVLSSERFVKVRFKGRFWKSVMGFFSLPLEEFFKIPPVDVEDDRCVSSKGSPSSISCSVPALS